MSPLEVFTNLIAEFIWFLLGLFGNRIWGFFRIIYPINKVVGKIGRRNERVVIVIPTFYANTNNLLKSLQDQKFRIMWNIRNPLYSEGDSSCLMFIYSLLLLAGKEYENVEIKSDREITGDDLRENLICVGAGSNDISRNFFESLEYSIDFDRSATIFGTAIIDRINRQRYNATINEDFSLILKTMNPHNSEKDLIMVAGLGPMGTKGAGYYLYRDWSHIARRLQFFKRDNYLILLEINQNDFTNIREITFTKEMVSE